MKKMFAAASLLFSLFVSPLVLADTVNINTADAAQLETLDGIGKKKAEAIIAYRTEHGDFKTLEDLKEVNGIGDKMFDKIKDKITLSDDAAAVADNKDKKTDAAAKAADNEAKPEAVKEADKVSDKTANKADKS